MIRFMPARRAFLAASLGLAASTALPFGTAAFAQEAPAVPDMMLGDPDAPITIIEYASFTCPHCANFHQTVMKDLKRDYIDTGKVRFIHREVFFDRYGLWASMVARCGGEMRYFGMADRIYGTQREWAQGDAAAIAGNLRRIGLTAGLTGEQIDACLNDNDTAQALVTWYGENAKEHEINSTPSFIIDGEKYGNMSYAAFAEILDEKLAG